MSTTKGVIRVEVDGREVIMIIGSLKVVLSRAGAAVLASKLQEAALGAGKR